VNLGLIAATFGLIFVAELPDKTFVATVVLAARHRSRAVWLGSAAGLILQAVLAVAAGRLLRLLPHTAVEAVVTGLFFVGAAYLLFVPESHEEGAAEGIAEEDAALEPAAASPRQIAFTTFLVITLAEFGDLTQVLIANLSARFGNVWSVFVGASLAFVVISGLAVTVGQTVERHVSLAMIRRVSAVVLIGLGIWSLVGLVT
jgi:putative Ca2+/H+ antiporter (TMEM165/GDT1 family)